MKKLFLLLTISASSIILKAQNDLVVFSEQGEQFYVVINGVKQNVKPETNVKVTGLKQQTVKAKIIFADGKTPDLDQTVYLMSGGNEVRGYEFVYAVKKKEKGYKLAYRSDAMIAQTPPPPGQTVIVYSTTPPPAIVMESITISTTTTTGATPTGTGISVGVNAGGTGFNMNVNINDPNMAATSSSSMTTTTTTSSSTTSSGHTHVPPPSGGNIYVLEGYNGPHNCNWPMSPGDFESAKSSIKSKSFEDSKLTMAKQVLNSNCLLSSQVKEVMMVFSFEDTRLELAKLAWGKTFDCGNYYKLNDAFTFESSIDELNKYIEGRR